MIVEQFQLLYLKKKQLKDLALMNKLLLSIYQLISNDNIIRTLTKIFRYIRKSGKRS